MKRRLTLGILVLLAFFSVYFGIRMNSQKEALVFELDFGNGNKKVFYNYTAEQKKAWSLLQQVAAISKIELRADENFVPQKIDGYLNGDENKKWNLYVNGEKKENSPMDVTVKVPDKIAFKFE